MSSRHAEHNGEYRRLACVAFQRLLASRSALPFQAATGAGNVHSLASMLGIVVGVTDRKCFCAHSVDIYVDVSHVVVPRARTPHQERAQNNRFRPRPSEMRPAARAAECP